MKFLLCVKEIILLFLAGIAAGSMIWAIGLWTPWYGLLGGALFRFLIIDYWYITILLAVGGYIILRLNLRFTRKPREEIRS